jgi:hypothetical protein
MRSLFILLALAMPAQAPPQPSKPVVIFPEEPVPVPPKPPPPSASVRLPADTLYVVRSLVPCLVLTSPQGIISVTPDAGPVRIMAKIWPSGETTLAKFTEPYLYFVQAQTSGTAELIVIPEGTKDAAGITRKLVESQLAPIPPPDPGPKPPDPNPSPAPIPVDGFRVLMIYESSELSKLSSEQRDGVLYGDKVRGYLNSHCATGPDGKTREFRIWDKDVDTSGEAKLWQDAMKRPWNGAPWVIISNGKAGFEGPLPKTEAEMLALLTKFGG